MPLHFPTQSGDRYRRLFLPLAPLYFMANQLRPMHATSISNNRVRNENWNQRDFGWGRHGHLQSIELASNIAIGQCVFKFFHAVIGASVSFRNQQPFELA